MRTDRASGVKAVLVTKQRTRGDISVTGGKLDRHLNVTSLPSPSGKIKTNCHRTFAAADAAIGFEAERPEKQTQPYEEEQKLPRIYVDRIARGDRHHRDPRRHAAARAGQGETESAAHQLSEQPQTM